MLARGNEVYYERTRSKDNGVGGRSPLNNLGKRAHGVGSSRVRAREKRTKNRRVAERERGKSKRASARARALSRGLGFCVDPRSAI